MPLRIPPAAEKLDKERQRGKATRGQALNTPWQYRSTNRNDGWIIHVASLLPINRGWLITS